MTFVLIVQIGLVSVTLFLWFVKGNGNHIAVYLALAVMVSSRIIPAINRIMGNLGGLLNFQPFAEGIINFKVEIKNQIKKISELSDKKLSNFPKIGKTSKKYKF